MGKNSESVVQKVEALLADAEPDTLAEIRRYIDSHTPSDQALAEAAVEEERKEELKDEPDESGQGVENKAA